MDFSEEAAATPEASAEEAEVEPFSFGDMDFSEEIGSREEQPQEPVAMPEAVDEEESTEITPLSLAELGLSEEEIASLQELSGETPATPEATAEEADEAEEDTEVEPFSFGDMDFSEEIGSLEESGVSTTPEEDTEVEPFSFGDMDFSEEIGSLEESGVSTTPEEDTEVEPFSFGDMDFSEEIGSLEESEASTTPETSAEETGEEPEIRPLSLTELGLSEEEIAALNESEGGGEEAVEAEEEPEVRPLSLAELGLSEEEISALNESEGDGEEAVEAEEEPAVSPLSLAELGLSDEEISALNESESSGEEAVETEEEPEVTPLSLAELGLSDEEIAALSDEETAEDTEHMPPPTSHDTITIDEAETTPFSFDELGLDEEETTGGEEETPEPKEDVEQPPARVKAPETQLLGDLDLQPFSLDDLDLEMSDLSSVDDQSMERLSLTTEELSGLDNFGGFSSDFSGLASAGDKDFEGSMPDTGDPALDRLIVLGQRQGHVDLTDIIEVVDDPVAESERIEDIGRALYRAGIEIRDGDEVIDMEEELDEDYYYDDEYEDVEVSGSDENENTTVPPTRPLSDEELELIEDMETGVAAAKADAAEKAQQQQQAAKPEQPPQQEESEPEVAPLSLAELGLSDEEIAMLGLGEGEEEPAPTEPATQEVSAAEPPEIEEEATPPAPAPSEPEPVQAEQPQPVQEDESAEPEIKPLSLAELGLSEEEIAMLGLGEGGVQSAAFEETAAEPTAEEEPLETLETLDTTAESQVVSEDPSQPEGTSQPAEEERGVETDIQPLSLTELGLSEEEISLLGLGGGSAASPPVAEEAKEVEEQQPPAEQPETPAAPEQPSPAEKPAGDSGEKDIAPLSLADLGLTEEEIAMLGLDAGSAGTLADTIESVPDVEKTPADTPQEPPQKSERPEPEGLGLSEEELAKLGGLASSSAPSSSPPVKREMPTPTDPFAIDDADLDLFDITEEHKAAATPIQRTRPRREEDEQEEEKPPSPEDLAFVPTPLEELDDIWDLPDEGKDEGPARVILEPKPAPPEPDEEAEVPRPTKRPVPGGTSKGGRSSARSATPRTPSKRGTGRGGKTERRFVSRSELLQSAEEEKDGEVESCPLTGDDEFDALISQFETEPDNYGLCLATAHMGMEKGYYDAAIFHYRRLVADGQMLEELVDDVRGFVSDVQDQSVLQQLYRLIGDTYIKLKRYPQAMAAYKGQLT
jgi:hypothetical protein